MRDFLTLVFRYKVYIGLIFCVTVASVGVGVHFISEVYEAKASILVKMGRENLSMPGVRPSAQQQVVSMGLRKEDINSEIRILKNRHILEKVIEKLGLDFLYPVPEKPDTFYKLMKFRLKQGVTGFKRLADETLCLLNLKKRISRHQNAMLDIEKKLSVEQVQNTDVIEVSIDWGDPDTAKTILDTLLELFYDHHMLAHKNSGGYKLIQEQVALAEKKLNDFEEQYEGIKIKQGITKYEQQEELLLAQITAFKAAHRNTLTDISETETRKRAIEAQLAALNETVTVSEEVYRNPILDTLKTTLIDLEIEEERLETKYLATSRPVLEIQRKIDEVRERMAREEVNIPERATKGLNTVYKEVERELLSLESSLKALREKQVKQKEHLDAYEDELRRLSANHLALKQLKRQIRLSEESYNFYRKRLEEARVAEVQDSQRVVNVRVISPPSASFTPVRPKKLLMLALAAIISLAGGIGFALVSDYLDQSIRSVEDAQRYLDLPTLTSIREL